MLEQELFRKIYNLFEGFEFGFFEIHTIEEFFIKKFEIINIEFNLDSGKLKLKLKDDDKVPTNFNVNINSNELFIQYEDSKVQIKIINERYIFILNFELIY